MNLSFLELLFKKEKPKSKDIQKLFMKDTGVSTIFFESLLEAQAQFSLNDFLIVNYNFKQKTLYSRYTAYPS